MRLEFSFKMRLLYHLFVVNSFLISLNFASQSTISNYECIGKSNLTSIELNNLSKLVIPTLDGLKKGDAGRIGVIGGSIAYTGAPYFSAISALRIGADIVFVITTENAAPVIKTYSPDLIVFPFLSDNNELKIKSLINKMDVIVIGPGLGREEQTMKLLYKIIEICKSMKKPLVIDADGLFGISKNVTVLSDYPSPGVILTPNFKEVRHLIEATTNDSNWYSYWGDNVSVLVKGETDHFYCHIPSYNWDNQIGGSSRRVGGQGDILSGSIGIFYKWALSSNHCKGENPIQLAQSVASYAAARLTRELNSKAFLLLGRSMLASDMLKHIQGAFNDLFE